MKELKDYLHLYLGCDMCYKYNPKSTWILVAVAERNYQIGLLTALRLGMIPILRPLSDMTEEEKLELIRVDHPETDYPIISMVEMKGACIFFTAKDERMKHSVVFSVGFNNHFSPIETIYLLSKHFDLFGLIKSGLAIDKTTLK